ncbi:MAG: type II toxin-antitoxin system RelB/DinJ family antitoxin [Deltaproteobacteria bacterium]|nr:type II toxin-antitoxin system RelB/DinJ family antitoxin [Deltaproteobacteria bacterium]
MKTATLNIRLDPSVKTRARKILEEIGLTTSEAITLFFKKVISEKGIPFAVKMPNRRTRKVIEDSRNGINVNEYDSVDDLFKSL